MRQQHDAAPRVRQMTESLREGDRAGQRHANTSSACDMALPDAHRADDETADPAGPCGVARQAQAERLRHRQHPLAVRCTRQHAVDQMRPRVCPRTTVSGRGQGSLILVVSAVLRADVYESGATRAQLYPPVVGRDVRGWEPDVDAPVSRADRGHGRPEVMNVVRAARLRSRTARALCRANA